MPSSEKSAFPAARKISGWPPAGRRIALRFGGWQRMLIFQARVCGARQAANDLTELQLLQNAVNVFDRPHSQPDCKMKAAKVKRTKVTLHPDRTRVLIR